MTIAAILAGGAGRRVGGGKPGLVLAGRALISYPLAAARAAGLEPVVVAKPHTPLPPLDAPVIHDASPTLHPLAGVVAALDHAQGPVVVVGADMPFVAPELLRSLAAAPGGAAVVVAAGELQPLCARYVPADRASLADAQAREAPLRATVAALGPGRVDADPEAVLNVNRPEDLRRAEARLRAPSAPRRPRPPSSR